MGGNQEWGLGSSPARFQPVSTPAPLILLVGMHRSGTSLLGSLLPALGVPMPGELIAADTHNPEGYYERADITALQEQLLIDLGRWWPSPAGADPLPAGWLDHPATGAAASQLKLLLAAELQRQAAPWAIKDPRTSLLLPLWRRVAAELQLPLKLVLSVRDPAEVMVSLLQRDAGAAGMTARRAQQLWWHHNRQLLLDAETLPLLVLEYGAWFEPRRRRQQLEQLSRFCLGQPATAARRSAAASLIRPGHRRSRRRRRDLPQPLHPWLLRLYGRLARLAAAGSPRPACGRLHRWLAPPTRALPPDPPPGPWLDGVHYRQQQPPLPAWQPAWLHYQLLGWRRGRSPHPLFEANHYRHQAHLRGLPSAGPPLGHFLRSGLRQGLPPSPLADLAWGFSSSARQTLLQAARLEGLHPWGPAALALCRGNQAAAIAQLRHWLHCGLDQAALAAIGAADPCQFSGDALQHPDPGPLPSRARLHCPEADLQHWQLHAWLQHLPLPPAFVPTDDSEATIHLLLAPLPDGPASLRLIALAGQPWVFTIGASNLLPLRRLGIAAQLLEPQPAGNGWLQRPGDAAAASRELGLPPAAALAQQARVLCLGTAGPAWERQLLDPIWCWPAFEAVAIASAEQARLLASWLNTCNRSGLQLVHLAQAVATPTQANGWSGLDAPATPAAGWLPPQRFQAPLQPSELLAELAWRAAGAPPEPAITTPRPNHRLLWQHQAGPPPQAAVCISLHNYADRILAALESVRAQTLELLELIVVDDASSDDGASRVQQWLGQHGQRFCRALLVQHGTNAGLAATRNTAFQLAEAPWCFVLDADNSLEPNAVAHCLALGQAAPSDIAVVHPLVELVGAGDATSLISGLSWQRAHFRERNVIDAMALVRRSAWQQVGGYDHIPGGWEDYDFWCKLIEVGLQGILCPQRLATYHSHPQSMLATHTHQQLRRISRVLQQRHPWLQLALAGEQV